MQDPPKHWVFVTDDGLPLAVDLKNGEALAKSIDQEWGAVLGTPTYFGGSDDKPISRRFILRGGRETVRLDLSLAAAKTIVDEILGRQVPGIAVSP